VEALFLHPADVDLRALVDEALAPLARQARAAAVSLQSRPPTTRR